MRSCIIAPLLIAGTALADKLSAKGVSLEKFRLAGAGGMTPAPGGEPSLNKNGTSLKYGLYEFDAYISSDFTISPLLYYAQVTLSHPENLGFRVARNIIRAKAELPENTAAYINSGVIYDPPKEVASLKGHVQGSEKLAEQYWTVQHDFGSQDLDVVGCGEKETFVAVSTRVEIIAEGDEEAGFFMSSKGEDEVRLQEIQFEWFECE